MNEQNPWGVSTFYGGEYFPFEHRGDACRGMTGRPAQLISPASTIPWKDIVVVKARVLGPEEPQP